MCVCHVVVLVIAVLVVGYLISYIILLLNLVSTDQIQAPLLKVYLQQEMYPIKSIVKPSHPQALAAWLHLMQKNIYLKNNDIQRLSS